MCVWFSGDDDEDDDDDDDDDDDKGGDDHHDHDHDGKWQLVLITHADESKILFSKSYTGGIPSFECLNFILPHQQLNFEGKPLV